MKSRFVQLMNEIFALIPEFWNWNLHSWNCFQIVLNYRVYKIEKKSLKDIGTEIVLNFSSLFTFHSMEIQGLFLPLWFTWNQFWTIWRHINCQFDHFIRSQFWSFWNFLTFSSLKYPKNQNSKPPKLLYQQFLTFWNQPKSPKLNSHKIRVVVKS